MPKQKTHKKVPVTLVLTVPIDTKESKIRKALKEHNPLSLDFKGEWLRTIVPFTIRSIDKTS